MTSLQLRLWTKAFGAGFGVRALALAFALGAVMLGVAREARAQATDIEPVYVVVTQDTELRCDAGAAWYAIADLKAGQVLRADGVSFDWLRVDYPAGTEAVVKVGEAELQAADQRVVLTRQTRLRAFNLEAQRIETCYKAVAQDLLPPGLALRSLGEVKNNRGEVAGYRVAAPSGARGYVLESATRRATEQEVNAVMGALSPAPAQGAPAVAQGATTTMPTGTSATPAPAQTPVQPVAAHPAVTTPAVTTGQPTGAFTSPTPLNTALSKDTQRTMDMIAELERAYKKVGEEPLEQAELQPLIDAYARLSDAARGTEAEGQVVRFAEVRTELLKVRRALQQSAAELAALDAEAARTTQDFAYIDQQVQASADFELIGRLVPSAVYAGGQMPLLYRLQAVDGVSSRTVAYLAPAPTLGLDGKLGAVVGVRGERRVDGHSDPVGVPVIEPTQVTVLQAASVVTAPTPMEPIGQ